MILSYRYIYVLAHYIVNTVSWTSGDPTAWVGVTNWLNQHPGEWPKNGL